MRIKISFVVNYDQRRIFLIFQTITIMSYIADFKLPYVRSSACVGQKYLKLCDDLGLPNHKDTVKKNKKTYTSFT